jgi:ABC-type branched-subunit amino acid transport system ATPase component/predicted MFS family arabinose efflux permease
MRQHSNGSTPLDRDEPAQLGDRHLADIRAEEATIAELEGVASKLLTLARQTFGIGSSDRPPTGSAEPPDSLSLVLVLGMFFGLDELLTTAFSAFAPDIKVSLALSDAAYGMIMSQRNNAAAAVALIVAATMHRARNRSLLVLQAAFSTGLGASLAAFSSNFWALFLAVALSGPTAGVAWAVHRPMVMDGCRPPSRAKKMSIYQSGFVIGAVLGPIVVWALTGPGNLTWRGALITIGALILGSSLLGVRFLKDPAIGRYDIDVLRSAVRHELKYSPTASVTEARLGFFETMRRLWLVPTVRKLLGAWAVLGVVLTPLLSYLSFLLADRWSVGLNGRAVFFSVAWFFAIPTFIWFAPRADRLYRSDPSRLVTACAWLLVVMATGLLITAAVPVLGVALVGAGLIFGSSAALTATLTVLTLSTIQPSARTHAGALIALFLVVVGGQGGAMLLGGLDRRFGPATAIAVLAAPALGAALLLRGAARTINGDIDQLLDTVIEQEEVTAQVHRGHRLPLLACRHIDFSYGQLQVLFDVNFTVDDGEMVALLGTNGAGKSTLLRVVSGLGLPSRGSVRLRGTDITFVDAEKRVAMGIGQIPGGRAVFGPLTIIENLRVFGYMHGRNRRAVESGISIAFEAFPALYARKDQPAATLSGGEQQMLGLASAFIVRPRLLLIDELSLGLAPRIVGELLHIVRRINGDGTAVVLVEQSVNVALSLVQHAYFMEKGGIRFDGVASDLLARPDLLRSVFLEGANRDADGQLKSRNAAGDRSLSGEST